MDLGSRRRARAAAAVLLTTCAGVAAGPACYQSVAAGDAELADDEATGATDASPSEVADEASTEVSDDAGEEAADAGAVPEPRECLADADCPGGWCRRIPDLPGGFWTCVYPPPDPATGPARDWGWDECTDSDGCEPDCGCYLAHDSYRGFPIVHNVCVCSECEADADCPHPAREMCVGPGTWGAIRNRCATALCRTNFDCVSRPDGQCIAVRDRCSYDYPLPVRGKYCRYPDDPCADDRDCGTDWCVPGPDGFTCAAAGCPEWPFPPF